MKNDGGSAFPVLRESLPQEVSDKPTRLIHHGWQGMSLRDWFAGMVLSGMGIRAAIDDPRTAPFDRAAAARAYAVADAMLEERKKEK